MSTITISDQPITVARGRPGSLPMRWQDPSGAAINITGFVLTAEFRWVGDVARTVPVEIENAQVGAFALIWSSEVTAGLPLGRLATLALKIVDGADGVHDFLIPVVGEQP